MRTITGMHCELIIIIIFIISLGLPITAGARYYNHPPLKDEKTEAQGLILIA